MRQKCGGAEKGPGNEANRTVCSKCWGGPGDRDLVMCVSSSRWKLDNQGRVVPILAQLAIFECARLTR